MKRLAPDALALWRSCSRRDVAAGAQQKQQPPPAGAPKDFVIPAPQRFTLANGLPVTLVPFGQVPKVTIRLVVERGERARSKRRRSGSPISPAA